MCLKFSQGFIVRVDPKEAREEKKEGEKSMFLLSHLDIKHLIECFINLI